MRRHGGVWVIRGRDDHDGRVDSRLSAFEL